jgi:glyoxylase-like metal-dependent hydrolase (beta-lactamase superfamily II)
MYLDSFSDNSFETNCWLIGADGTDDAVVVDPGFSPEGIRALLLAAGKRPHAVLATHGHFDHIGSAAELCGDELPFYIHEADAPALSDPQGWGAGHEVPPVPVKDVRTVIEGEVLTFAGFRIEVMHTPGHTPGSVCLYAERHRLLFVGDNLQVIRRKVTFASSVFSDDMSLARASVARLAELDVQTIVFSHYPPLRDGANGVLRALANRAARLNRQPGTSP